MSSSLTLHQDNIQQRIHFVRGMQVMLDKDLAELYEVKPIRLREQAKRNSKRFPSDFMFQLNDEEVNLMVSQNAIPSRRVLSGSMPFVFTEQVGCIFENNNGCFEDGKHDEDCLKRRNRRINKEACFPLAQVASVASRLMMSFMAIAAGVTSATPIISINIETWI